MRSLLKALSYRVLASGVTFGVGFAVTDSLPEAGLLTLVLAIVKVVGYIIHERVWKMFFRSAPAIHRGMFPLAIRKEIMAKTYSFDCFMEALDRQMQAMDDLEDALRSFYGTDRHDRLHIDVLEFAKDNGWGGEFWDLKQDYDLEDPSQLAEAIVLHLPHSISGRILQEFNVEEGKNEK